MMSLFVTTLLFALTGLAINAFALAKTGHFKDVLGKRPTQQQSQNLLYFAWITILLSLGACLSTAGAYGSLVFFGFLTCTGVLATTLLNTKPRWLKLLCAVYGTIIVVFAALAFLG
ncbi:DUF3325 domain-containing protein [Pseudoalteromonas fenneropenaei]|uniref:DUF3325 domain-containing protein n=1 Tax=Pseudoalteromonas fenneropenaei TaxID=1737459 RepID=A0ABV7CIV4_9GAMM